MVDEREEYESEGEEAAEPVAERVRITGAEPVGGLAPEGEPAWGSAIGTEPSSSRRYLGFDVEPEEPSTETLALGSRGAQETPSQEPDAEPRAAEPLATDLPHWTEPPTGQVPAILDRRGDDDEGPLGDTGPAWREHQHEWDDAAFEPALLADEETRVGALDDEAPPEHLQWEFGDLSEEDALGHGEDLASAPAPLPAVAEAPDDRDVPEARGAAAPEPAPLASARHVISAAGEDAGVVPPDITHETAAEALRVAVPPAARAVAAQDEPLRVPAAPAPPVRRHAGSGPRANGRGQPAGRGPEAPGGGKRNVPLSVATGIVAAVVALVCFSLGTVATVALGTVVVVLAAAECFAALRRGGYRPATLLGLVACGGLIVAAYAKGVAAFPLVIALTVGATMVWYLVGAERGSPTRGIGATLLGFAWIGVLGGFAGLILAPSQYPHRHGIAFLLGAVVAVVGADVGALVVGSWIGRHPLAPRVSPNKTWEGFVGGFVVAVVASVVITGHIAPWTPSKAAVLGVVAAILGPIGDLSESLLKRDLGLKDMGSLLPGHGGVLDRVDALLFVLPATYYLVRVLHLG